MKPDGEPVYPVPRPHRTPRMHQRPDDPAYFMLYDDYVSEQKVYRDTCYICRDQEFARMGLPLCNSCCACTAKLKGVAGHIAADDGQCDDCDHAICETCLLLPPQVEEICTCDSPCCEADVGVGIVTCGSAHCPTHGVEDTT